MRLVYAAALLAILFASISAAYSMWSETLKVSATVNTGEVAVAFKGYQCSDTGPDPQGDYQRLDGMYPFHNEEGKDVASCNVIVSQTNEGGNAIELQITIDNAYPGYEACIDFNVTNIGTIPVKLLNYQFSDNLAQLPLVVDLHVPEDTQIHPGDNSTYTLCIGVHQAAEENASYSFSLTLTFAQWNEVPTQQQ